MKRQRFPEGILAEVHRVIDLHARRYRARLPDYAYEDFYQAGWVGALEALNSYDPERGPLQPFIYRPVVWAMSRVHWRMRGAISSAYQTARRHETVWAAPSEVLEGLPAATLGPERKTLLRGIVARLLELINELDPTGETLGILLDGGDRRDVMKTLVRLRKMPEVIDLQRIAYDD